MSDAARLRAQVPASAVMVAGPAPVTDVLVAPPPPRPADDSPSPTGSLHSSSASWFSKELAAIRAAFVAAEELVRLRAACPVAHCAYIGDDRFPR